MSGEQKKHQQAAEAKTAGEPLSESELDKAVGGTEVSLPYAKIEWVYTQQKRAD